VLSIELTDSTILVSDLWVILKNRMVNFFDKYINIESFRYVSTVLGLYILDSYTTFLRKPLSVCLCLISCSVSL